MRYVSEAAHIVMFGHNEGEVTGWARVGQIGLSVRFRYFRLFRSLFRFLRPL